MLSEFTEIGKTIGYKNQIEEDRPYMVANNIPENAVCVRCYGKPDIIHDFVSGEKSLGIFYTCKECRVALKESEGKPEIFISYPFTTVRR